MMGSRQIDIWNATDAKHANKGPKGRFLSHTLSREKRWQGYGLAYL